MVSFSIIERILEFFFERISTYDVRSWLLLFIIRLRHQLIFGVGRNWTPVELTGTYENFGFNYTIGDTLNAPPQNLITLLINAFFFFFFFQSL